MSNTAQDVVDGIKDIIRDHDIDCKGEVHYILLYDLIIAEIDRLKSQDVLSDYKQIKALAALYAVHEYAANQLAAYANELDC